MKKIALTSMLAMFAASSAMATSISNPLYRPVKGQFYSETDLSMATNRHIDMVSPYEQAGRFDAYGEDKMGIGTKGATVTETLGFGITDRVAIMLNGSASTQDWFEFNFVNSLGAELNARVYDNDGWKGDIFGSYSVNDVRVENTPAFKSGATWYTWTAGARAGYTTDVWTVAAHAALDYRTSESFKLNPGATSVLIIDEETGMLLGNGEYRNTLHIMRFGIDGQVYVTDNWNLVAGAEYVASYDFWSQNIGYWKATVGANYDFDPCTYAGVYATKYIAHEGDNDNAAESAGNWKALDGFVLGAKFGVKF